MQSAHKIGSLLFCPQCGTLLSAPTDDGPTVECEQCHHLEPTSSYENIEIVTHSHPDAFPSALRQKRKTQTKIHQGKVLPKVSEKCPACGYMEAYYEEKQMRSADEGSTILYTCVSCKHGWRVNN
ncbi:transcription factor S-II-domain-containing protein [Pisolithus sp. B1]|nr:transcription factor S-II-domain-containing protein [Pisolithus sp. B1]